MMTPARRHLLRHQAQAANQQENQIYANGYELMLAKLATDKRRLKAIQSIERKIEVKGELLPDYQPWVSGVLAADSQQQDDVFMTVLLWTLDTGDFPAAYPMAEHALKHGWVTPDQYQRQTACMVAEEVADTALKQLTAGTFAALDSLLAFAGLLASQDMPDQVRARLHKALGLAHSESQPQEALAQFQRALQLDENVGVKKLIEQLERQIRNNPPDQSTE
ncbi:terminase [Escherichia coli]|nr:terminase [Escherichia coli]